MVSTESSIEARVVAVVGLGYVGLPLALAFGKSPLKTYGFDINSKRVEALKQGIDVTAELSIDEVKNSQLIYTSDEADLQKADFLIVAVPTPVNKANQPDLMLLEKASEMIGRNLKKGAIVVYESTVYPGVTEDVCAPILAKVSGLILGTDFKVGYSPERINPGDKEHTLEKIVKVVAGMDAESTQIIADTYKVVCLAGVHVAPNIKTAEAAKVIENTQRDLNIGLMNELSLIFHRIGINTQDVLAAAGTKWNFLRFTPGLVGGHCIGVDPYYLVMKAEELGYHPQVIMAGRRVNDFMPEFVAQEVISGLVAAGAPIQGSKVLVMGLTFKENVKDLRNSKIKTTIKKLQEYGVEVSGYDPLLVAEDVEKEFAIKLVTELQAGYDGVILAASHRQFEDKQDEVVALMQKPVIFDVKNLYPSLRGRKGVIYKNL